MGFSRRSPIFCRRARMACDSGDAAADETGDRTAFGRGLRPRRRGAGIYGACVAWDAALRGLRVALVEQGDFGQETSANSLRTVHGGLRYLQHADFRRMRESIRERAALFRIAPHLVRPFPFMMPTYGHGVRGPEALALGLAAMAAIGFGLRREGLPRAGMLSPADCLKREPGIRKAGLTGGALWYDGVMSDPERLLWSIVRAGSDAGAEAANYVRVEALERAGGRLTGVRASDLESGKEFSIRASHVVATVGPWQPSLAGRFGLPTPVPGEGWIKALNLVTRPLGPDFALGVARPRGGRLYFLLPGRGCSLIGTDYIATRDAPDDLQTDDAEVLSFIARINEAFPAARLELPDVRMVQAGLLPARAGRPESLDASPRISDARVHGVDGLFAVTGVKFTTARAVAEEPGE